MVAAPEYMLIDRLRDSRASRNTAATVVSGGLAVILTGLSAAAAPERQHLVIEYPQKAQATNEVSVRSTDSLDLRLAGAMVQHARELAQAQTYLRPEESRVLYERMRELILR